MKLISWNVNGLRACLDKGFLDFFAQADADVFCLQETKMQPGPGPAGPAGAITSTGTAPRKRAIPARRCSPSEEPLSVSYGIGPGGARTRRAGSSPLEYPEFYLVNVLHPQLPGRALARLDYRMQWEDDFRAYLCAAGRP